MASTASRRTLTYPQSDWVFCGGCSNRHPPPIHSRQEALKLRGPGLVVIDETKTLVIPMVIDRMPESIRHDHTKTCQMCGKPFGNDLSRPLGIRSKKYCNRCGGALRRTWKPCAECKNNLKTSEVALIRYVKGVIDRTGVKYYCQEHAEGAAT